ncbi:hypothetical protein [Halegenticoccus tardaugens]|uniref:hypothetical protein n=1 Tax=Halegenticoccus tardaugens TaxID=2071624 RepID=UPI00100C0D30|nr:hypothetical protein [Halegenticoccus tardaugens]
MTLACALIEERARQYEREEPLFAVEQDNIETFPAAFLDETYTWKDAEWIVQWYYRRFLGAFPDGERRAGEKAYRRNEFSTVQSRIRAAIETDESTEKIRQLTTLEGVDVPVASAFLLFIFPKRYIVVGEREWEALHEANELTGRYPGPPSASEYEVYLTTCREAADRCAVDLWTLYRALWRLAGEHSHAE